MKKSDLILLSTTIFVTLFYDESVGINLGIVALSYAILLFAASSPKVRTRTFYILFASSVLSSFAFAWYGDFISFLAILLSLSFLVLKSRNRELKSILALPALFVNMVTFLGRVAKFSDWIPDRRTSGLWQRIIATILIPLVFIGIFLAIYTTGSSQFSAFFQNLHFDLDLWEFLCLAVAGFFLAFTFFNFKVYDFLFIYNHGLKDDFLNEDRNDKPTYSFMDIDAERKSGVISLVALNLLLCVFIITFNYEQFVELPKTPSQLSIETHARVNAVIGSIVMAIMVILFYFKGNFNFDKKAKSLKLLAKIWIFLNMMLVISALVKNSEYVLTLGLTYKRLGVYAFLLLAIIGLMITYVKIKNQKTNAFLFNQMIWYFYATVLVCSFINWGSLATSYNIKKGINDYRFLSTFKYNDKILMTKFPVKYKNTTFIDPEKEGTFLSETLFDICLPKSK